MSKSTVGHLDPGNHWSALAVALQLGDDESIAEVEQHLARGDELPRAGIIFTTARWSDENGGRLPELMQRYLDAGYFGVHDTVVVDIESSQPLFRYRTPLLCLAILSANPKAAEVLLANGALEHVDIATEMANALRASHGDMPEHHSGKSAEQMLDTLVVRMYRSTRDEVLERCHGALARRAAALMSARIDAPAGPAAPAGSRPRLRAV